MQNLISPEAIWQANYDRLRRASQQVNDYRLDRIAGTDAFLVAKNGSAYQTSETSCTCMDAQKRPELVCKHRAMVIARLDVEGRVTANERRAQILRDREMWG